MFGIGSEYVKKMCCVGLSVHHKSLGKSILFNGSCVLLPSEYFKTYTLKMIVRYIWIMGKKKASEYLIFQGFLMLFNCPIILYRVTSWTKISCVR